MDAGKPDPDPAQPAAQSLSHRFAWAFAELPQGGWPVAAAFGALLAAGPLLTLAGAMLLTQHERRATFRLQDELAPRLAAQASARAARTALANAAGRAAPAQVLEILAGVLPADAVLARVERTRDGGLEVDVVGADPDALRAAIRRAPEFAAMRNTSQRRTDAAMILSLREDAQ